MPYNYEVGYKKPPKHTRFKKGQSGNPKGKRKGTPDMKTVLREVLTSKVSMTLNGRKRDVPYMKAFGHQLAAKGLHGSVNDQIKMLAAIHKYVPEALSDPNTPEVLRVEYVLPDGTVQEYYDSMDHMGRSKVNRDGSPRTDLPESESSASSEDSTTES